MRVKVGRRWDDRGPGHGQLTPARQRFDIDQQLATSVPADLVRERGGLAASVTIEVRYGR